MAWSTITLWFFGWLLWWTIWDLRCRAIYVWQTVLVLAVGLVWQGWQGELGSLEILGGILLGAGAILFSLATRDRFGMGDALVILCLGLYHGFAVALAVSTGGLMLASVAALGLLLLGHGRRDRTLPLIPFLWLSYVGVLWLEG